MHILPFLLKLFFLDFHNARIRVMVLRHNQQYFSYIVAVSFIGGRNRNAGETRQPVTSH
jgi:hypothetical protein